MCIRESECMKMKKAKECFVVEIILLVVLVSLVGCMGETKNENAKKNSSNISSIDVSELIGQPFDVAVEKFGDYSIRNETGGGQSRVFSDGLALGVSNGLISRVSIDLSKISDKTKYSYKGIDGNSTRDDVIKILGEPEDLRFTSDNYKRYPIDDYEFDVTYSDDGLVIKFTFEQD